MNLGRFLYWGFVVVIAGIGILFLFADPGSDPSGAAAGNIWLYRGLVGFFGEPIARILWISLWLGFFVFMGLIFERRIFRQSPNHSLHKRTRRNPRAGELER
jgi:uncharacterized membrane protein